MKNIVTIKLKKSLSLIYFLCWSFFLVSAQDNNLLYTTFSTQNGLSHNTVWDILQDCRGIIWAATSNGVVRFNGNSFDCLPGFDRKEDICVPFHNEINQLTEDPCGNIWMRTDNGQYSCYDPRRETFVAYAEPRILDNCYTEIVIDSLTSSIWLWGEKDGCVQITYNENGEYVSKEYMLDDIEFYDNEVYFIANSRDLGKIVVASNSIYFFKNEMKRVYEDKAHLQIFGCAETFDKIYFFTQSACVLVYDKRLHKFLDVLAMPKEMQGTSLISLMGVSERKVLVSNGEAVYQFDTSTCRFDRAESLFRETTKMKNVRFMRDNADNVWAYDLKGNVWLYGVNGQTVKLNFYTSEVILSQGVPRYTFYQDSRGWIWIATYGDGLYVYKSETGELTHLQSDLKMQNTITSNDLLTIMEDASGVMWIGTEYNGISRIAVPHCPAQTIYPVKSDILKKVNSVKVLQEDSLHRIWMGNALGALFVYDDQYRLQQQIKHSVDWTTSAYDTTGYLWFGTKENGIYVYEPGGKLLGTLKEKASDPYALPSNKINEMLCDDKGRMWIGMENKGLTVALRENETDVSAVRFRSFFAYERGVNTIYAIAVDTKGNIWASGNEGLYVFNPDSLLKNDSHYRFISYQKYDTRKIATKQVRVIYEDSRHYIWLASKGGGLTCYMCGDDFMPLFVKHYTMADGLPDNTITNIIEDTGGILWLTTENGVCRLDVDKEIVENFVFSNITLGNIFNFHAALSRSNGDILLGSMCGCHHFNPATIHKDDYLPEVIISAMKINGENIEVGVPGSPLSSAVSYLSEVEVEYGKDVITFGFLLPNYNNDHLNKYAYKLDGYDTQWNVMSGYNEAIYRNLPVGRYVLNVKACNSAGVWTESGKRLAIVVNPPVYRSVYAIVFYILLLLLIIVLGYRLISKLNFLNEQVKIEKELHNYKLRFLSNMSNEVKQPIEETLNSLSELEQNTYQASPLQQKLREIMRNISRILYMTDLLFETEKQGHYSKELALERTNAVTFLYDVYHEFVKLAQLKEIAFDFESIEDSILLPVDKIKMGRIISDLLIVCFDLTPLKGKIQMGLYMNENDVSICLKCDGRPFPDHLQKLISDKDVFEKLLSPLEMVVRQIHDLLEVHRGVCRYSYSKEGENCFDLRFSLDPSTYQKKDFISKVEYEEEESVQSLFMLSEKDAETIENNCHAKYRLLLANMDESLSKHLTSALEHCFSVVSVNSYQEAVCMMRQDVSLLILGVSSSDSELYRFVKSCKEDYQICHIPIVLLSTCVSMECQLKGIEAGADAFIVKPFSLKYLYARIVKLCEQREKLQQRFSEDTSTIPNIAVEEKDRSLMEQINELIEENILNPDLSVEDLMEHVQMKRTVFYKRLKALTGCSPNEYIRTIRMKKAADLLLKQQYNISEVCYKVGFTDPYYFSRCFKAHFGESPSSWLKKQEHGRS